MGRRGFALLSPLDAKMLTAVNIDSAVMEDDVHAAQKVSGDSKDRLVGLLICPSARRLS